MKKEYSANFLSYVRISERTNEIRRSAKNTDFGAFYRAARQSVIDGPCRK